MSEILAKNVQIGMVDSSTGLKCTNVRETEKSVWITWGEEKPRLFRKNTEISISDAPEATLSPEEMAIADKIVEKITCLADNEELVVSDVLETISEDLYINDNRANGTIYIGLDDDAFQILKGISSCCLADLGDDFGDIVSEIIAGAEYSLETGCWHSDVNVDIEDISDIEAAMREFCGHGFKKKFHLIAALPVKPVQSETNHPVQMVDIENVRAFHDRDAAGIDAKVADVRNGSYAPVILMNGGSGQYTVIARYAEFDACEVIHKHGGAACIKAIIVNSEAEAEAVLKSLKLGNYAPPSSRYVIADVLRNVRNDLESSAASFDDDPIIYDGGIDYYISQGYKETLENLDVTEFNSLPLGQRILLENILGRFQSGLCESGNQDWPYKIKIYITLRKSEIHNFNQLLVVFESKVVGFPLEPLVIDRKYIPLLKYTMEEITNNLYKNFDGDFQDNSDIYISITNIAFYKSAWNNLLSSVSNEKWMNEHERLITGIDFSLRVAIVESALVVEDAIDTPFIKISKEKLPLFLDIMCRLGCDTSGIQAVINDTMGTCGLGEAAPLYLRVLDYLADSIRLTNGLKPYYISIKGKDFGELDKVSGQNLIKIRISIRKQSFHGFMMNSEPQKEILTDLFDYLCESLIFHKKNETYSFHSGNIWMTEVEAAWFNLIIRRHRPDYQIEGLERIIEQLESHQKK